LHKKGPHGVSFGRSDTSFHKRTIESGPRPVRPAGVGARPDWKRPGASDGVPRSAGTRPSAPKKWAPRPDSKNNKPRLFGKAESRPVRSGSGGGRPDWRKSAAAGGGASGAPRKWTQGAPAASGRPRAFAASGKPRSLEKKPGSFGSRPDQANSRPDRPGKPLGGARREDSRGDRDTRPDARPARPGSERKPFWQAADKRRPRKPKEEHDFEPRESRTSGERPLQGDRPRKTRAVGLSRPKFSAPKRSSSPSSKPFSRPSSGPGKKRR
jgi:hypothetical protein